MERKVLLGTDILALFSVTLAWNCSDDEEKKLHPWCEHGCCIDKHPVECCTWAESMGSVFWTFAGFGSGILVLSLVVGIICRIRRKRGFEGQIISINGGQRQGANSSLDPSRHLNNGNRLNTMSCVPSSIDSSRQINSGNHINRNFESHQNPQGYTWTTNIRTNTSNHSNRDPRVSNIRNSTSFHMQTSSGNSRNNLHTRSATTETSLNSNSAQRQSATQIDAQQYAEPPPSYESLFNSNT